MREHFFFEDFDEITSILRGLLKPLPGRSAALPTSNCQDTTRKAKVHTLLPEAYRRGMRKHFFYRDAKGCN